MASRTAGHGILHSLSGSRKRCVHRSGFYVVPSRRGRNLIVLRAKVRMAEGHPKPDEGGFVHSSRASDRRRFIPIARTDISTNTLLGKFNGIDCKFARFALRFGSRPIAPHSLGDSFYGLGDRKNSRPNSGSAFRTRKKGPTEALIFISTANVYKICEILHRQNKKTRLAPCFLSPPMCSLSQNY